MQTVLTVTADDWAHARFVRSRLWEVNHAIRALRGSRGRRYHRAWLETLDVPSALARLPVLVALNPASGWVPDFLVPGPTPEVVDVTDELQRVAAQPLGLIAADARRSLLEHPTRARHAVLDALLADPAALLAAVVDELRWAWEELLAPFWAPVSRLVEADLAYRSRVASRSGLGRVLDELHPSIARDGERIVLTGVGERTGLGRGLALMPSAFVWPSAVLVDAVGWPTTIVYPARGIAELWQRPPAPTASLVEVLGRTRALLLTDLAEPATTTALAVRHRLSPAAVSMQLGRLRGAGLLTAERAGREVRYQRTPLAAALLAGSRR